MSSTHEAALQTDHTRATKSNEGEGCPCPWGCEATPNLPGHPTPALFLCYSWFYLQAIGGQRDLRGIQLVPCLPKELRATYATEASASEMEFTPNAARQGSSGEGELPWDRGWMKSSSNVARVAALAYVVDKSPRKEQGRHYGESDRRPSGVCGAGG
jgi:hypothetical protein